MAPDDDRRIATREGRVFALEAVLIAPAVLLGLMPSYLFLALPLSAYGFYLASRGFFNPWWLLSRPFRRLFVHCVTVTTVVAMLGFLAVTMARM